MASSDISLRFLAWSRKRRYAKDLPTLLRLLDPTKNDVMLDVGAGTGVIANAVAEKCDEVFALEPNYKRVEFIRKRFPQVKAFSGSSDAIAFPESYFTKIFTVSAFHHFPDQDASLQEFYRVMKNGGTLVIHEQDPNSWESKLEGHFGKMKFQNETDLKEKIEIKGFIGTETMKGVRGYFMRSSKPSPSA
jgi:ubiquinone/menaquinone biosynthesis C-methylase UbiE